MGPGRSVEACWLPLTPEHGFPSLLYKDARRSPPSRHGLTVDAVITSLLKKKKNRLIRQPREKSDPSYVGIIRIRFMGRRSYLPLSLLNKLPLDIYYTPDFSICKSFFFAAAAKKTVILSACPAYTECMLKNTGGMPMEQDIDDLIYGAADPGPSSR